MLLLKGIRLNFFKFLWTIVALLSNRKAWSWPSDRPGCPRCTQHTCCSYAPLFSLEQFLRHEQSTTKRNSNAISRQNQWENLKPFENWNRKWIHVMVTTRNSSLALRLAAGRGASSPPTTWNLFWFKMKFLNFNFTLKNHKCKFNLKITSDETCVKMKKVPKKMREVLGGKHTSSISPTILILATLLHEAHLFLDRCRLSTMLFIDLTMENFKWFEL